MPPDPDELRAMYAMPADPTTEPAVLFPLRWYEAFLQAIVKRGIVVITYADIFSHSDDWDHASHFQREYDHWQRRVRDPKKTYLLIQHDVDNHPFVTERMLAMEMIYGIRSNVFIFKDRWSAARKIVKYPVNHEFLRRAEREGFVIGYHSNALQIADFDFDRAQERFRADVAALREHYDIRFMVPHGGIGQEVDGRTVHNCDLPIPPDLARQVRWVYNKHAVRFARRYSDGGIRKSRDAERLAGADIIHHFLDALEPGTRSFCLVHPQRWGYHIEAHGNPMLAAMPWYADVCRRYEGVIAADPEARV